MLSKFVAFILTLAVLTALWMNQTLNRFPVIAGDLLLQRIDGVQQTFTELRGKPLLVTFWSPSCVVCMHEVDALNALYQQHQGGQRFELLGLSMAHDRPDSILETSRARGMRYPVYLDLDNELASAFGPITATPTSFILNADGEIVYRHTGKLDMAEVSQQLNDLMG